MPNSMAGAVTGRVEHEFSSAAASAEASALRTDDSEVSEPIASPPPPVPLPMVSSSTAVDSPDDATLRSNILAKIIKKIPPFDLIQCTLDLKLLFYTLGSSSGLFPEEEPQQVQVETGQGGIVLTEHLPWTLDDCNDYGGFPKLLYKIKTKTRAKTDDEPRVTEVR